MKLVDLHDFCREVECFYDGERYSVRDNGAVLRHPPLGKRIRPTDEQWTFGKPNVQNGYMYISQVRIHRIVATAFHGEPPTTEHIVDHIDTNRRNNRPENLRWLTRLENALLNPITVKRIEFICGSIEAFLEDPSRLRHDKLERNFEWMRTVTPQEAQACRERMHLWAKSDKPTSGDGSLGEWVFKPIVSARPLAKTDEASRTSFTNLPADEPDLVMSKTPGAAQRKWRTPTEFPCCPQIAEEDPITAYATNLIEGSLFSRNDFSTHAVLEAAVIDDGKSVYVMCEQISKEAIKPWSIAKITFENGLYVHTSIRTFFDKTGVQKEFCLARGLEWTGGDSIDDYC